MKLNSPQEDLRVLSACRTALGDEQAELGFNRLGGAKSSENGYRQLDPVPFKAEALRQAQIAMLKSEGRLKNAQLRVPGLAEGVPLPLELCKLGNVNLSHPYDWAAFTIVGRPWSIIIEEEFYFWRSCWF